MENRPRSREKHVVGSGSGVHRRGNGLGTGPVGSGGGKRSSGGGGGRSGRSGGRGGSSKLFTILVVVILLLKAYSYLSGGGGSGYLDDGFAGGDFLNYGMQSSWKPAAGRLDTSVAPGSREKYTDILGDGRDVVTVMVYMCGTDLESKSGMATADLKEMLEADIRDNVNLIVYTGGCKQWKNSVVSSKKNQIYQVKNGKLVCLEDDMGTASLTKPSTLTEFIRYCAENFPANRKELILWDHGGGSLSGFGYDEKNSSGGSMGLSEINTALSDAGIKYDFIGFDACLMATLENSLMLAGYADYLIASEETEPGVGWYYTDWLTALSKDTSMPTVQIGKNIVDDFVDVCAQRCAGQKTTLSVVDLAELQETVPSKLTAFAVATKDMIQNDGYRQVSDARYGAREFAQSSKIDQIDLVHLTQNLGHAEGTALGNAILGAVKYNRTSANMSNANGLSIYFPYKKMGKVDTAVSEYRQIGMDAEYTRCIQEFAGMEVSGQMSAGNSGTGSLTDSVLGGILSQLGNELGDLDLSALNFLSNRDMSGSAESYLRENSFDASKLVWTRDADGSHKLKLTEKQWSLIQELELSVYYDDGGGYVDLGLDNVFSLDGEGNLIGDYDNTWLSVNGQVVAYYHTDTAEEGDHYSITGYVPVMLNGSRAELILVFDDDRPKGYIAGARYVYKNGETETVAKSMTAVQSGDRLEFLCDYYSYDGTYRDSYYLGEPMTLGDEVVIGNADIGDGKARVMYKLTDIYRQSYWTPEIPE